MAAQAATLGFETEVASSAAEVAASARLIVTTTPASEPILYAANILPGTHITAVGADSPHKGELSDDLLGRADLLAADSLAQSRQRGEFRRASPGASIIELGDLIAASPHVARPASAITIADLTGVAVQDCAIAQAVLAALDFSEAG
jgi:ornithine cyclodeaminase